jgi:homoserine dehydrogenase
MDGAPVFNLVRHNLPGVTVLGFTGALNSTSKLVIETMERGGSFEDGLALARSLGVTEADASFDVEGWDSAAKTAALANVLMDARTTPQAVSTRGITRLTPERIAELARAGKTVRLISRARRGAGGITLRVRAEVLDKTDVLAAGGHVERAAAAYGFDGDHRDGVDLAGVEQTAYGVFGDLVELHWI